jgi:hypothetical protein
MSTSASFVEIELVEQRSTAALQPLANSCSDSREVVLIDDPAQVTGRHEEKSSKNVH